ncbi:hypothetical protein [Dyella telluris]|uniref:Uncharacterized protein n=1 Tax=Dyella telluris TaxID=2763498 RepID=A0A7G8Q4J3_9GAMM|nr:hypothetical protein [Dyella telluris]QNK01701.1 hypothetical protein H8F01_00530 [Dyella telluris]
MKRIFLEPTVREEAGPMGGLIYEHPAYAQIGASRISGMTNLYGSDFNHQHFIRIRIASSSIRRDLSTDWVHAATKPYIEVDLSEAQWAHFVSSPNVGMGSQCTLRYREPGGNGYVPELAPPQSRTKQFAGEVRKRLETALSEVDELHKMLGELKLPIKQKAALQLKASTARAQMTGNMKFVADMFDEHMEKTVESAKSEVDAYVVQTIQRAGMEALKNTALTYDPVEMPKIEILKRVDDDQVIEHE